MVTRAVIIGAGNVATHLARGLHSAGISIAAVCARHADTAGRLAAQVGASVCTAPADIPADADLVLISVSDAAVADVAAALPVTGAVVAHTSGSVPIEALSARHPRAAVLYPLQTFSRDVEVDLARVPLFTEATDASALDAIDGVARRLSASVFHADSDKRRHLHVAGVMACNFPVYLLEQCREVLGQAGFPLEVVRPLVEATLDKAFAIGPREAMTGPARRGDMDVARSHEQMLPAPVAHIYRLISTQIYDMYHEQH